jgi:tetratricopeptide (TPR) repeat protein
VVALALSSAGLLHCQNPSVSDDSEVSEADRARFARRRLEDSRALVAEGRLDAAERNLLRGIAVRPDDAALHRALGRVLDSLGRSDEARAHYIRAAELDPVEPLPQTPLVDAQGILVVLVPPEEPPEPLNRKPVLWPDGVAARTLRNRLRVRLPGATIAHAEPATVAKAHRWLNRYRPRAVISLRVDRSFCGESVKDGQFAVAWLRLAAEAPNLPNSPPRIYRDVVLDPDPAEPCEIRAVARALEAALLDARLARVLAAEQLPEGILVASRSGLRAWSRASIRALFPGIGQGITAEIEAGRVLLAGGEIAASTEAFQRALHIDPEDPFARAYLHEAESTLAMVHELGRSAGTPPDDNLDPRLSAAQAAAIEARLAEEQLRRDDLLAALAVLDEDASMPASRLLETLRVTPVRDPAAFGPTVARARAGGEIEARAAYAPDGGVLARYYFPVGGSSPLVREEDTNGDDRPDRWIGYSGTNRAEIWEDSHGDGQPNLHFVFAEGGTPIEMIEIDSDIDGRPERVFHYEAGILRVENRDTDGDGELDAFDRMNSEGEVIERGEDLNGDGSIDVRSIYRDGKLVRREFSNPEVATESVGGALLN